MDTGIAEDVLAEAPAQIYAPPPDLLLLGAQGTLLYDAATNFVSAMESWKSMLFSELLKSAASFFNAG